MLYLSFLGGENVFSSSFIYFFQYIYVFEILPGGKSLNQDRIKEAPSTLSKAAGLFSCRHGKWLLY